MLFLLPSSVHVLSASLPFHGLCAFLSRSLPARSASLSFFRISCLVSVPAFVPLFSCTVSLPSSPQFFGSVFLPVVPVPLSCVFLRSCTALSSLHLPHLFDPPPGLFLVQAFRACAVLVFDCIGVPIVLPCSPLPSSGLGSAFPPCCYVFLAVLRCPVVALSSLFLLIFSLPPLPFLSGFGIGSGFFSCIAPFPFLWISCWLSVFCLLPRRFFRLRVSIMFGCRLVHIHLLLLCSHFRFVLSLACYPSFMGWFLTRFASSPSSVCCVSGFLPARSVSCFLPLDFLVLFRPLLPLSLCVLCFRLFTVRLSCAFLY